MGNVSIAIGHGIFSIDACLRSLWAAVRLPSYRRTLHANASIDVSSFTGGAVAQLGARLDGIEEVVGSNPIGSTKIRLTFLDLADTGRSTAAPVDDCGH